RHSQPLELQAAKSRVLHTEPAAGAVGVAQLALRLGQAGRHDILHLRVLNPHVASVIEGHASTTACRQDAPAVYRAPELHGSVSSFAFQGTNAHAVLGLPGLAVIRTPRAEPWQRNRLWYQAPPHPLLQHFKGLSRPPTSAAPHAWVQCSLCQPALSYLLDHSLQGLAVLPSTLLLEMAWAAGETLRPEAPTANPVAVSGASFHHQFVLESGAQSVITCGVAVGSGAVWLAGQPRSVGEPALKLFSAWLQAVPQSNICMGGALTAGMRCKPSTGCDAASSLGAAPASGAATMLYLASVLAWGAKRVPSSNTSSIEADMLLGYRVPPGAAFACQQLASLDGIPAMHTRAALPAAVGAYVSLQHSACRLASAASAAGDGCRSDQQLFEAARQVLAVIDSRLKAAPRLPAEPHSELSASAILGSAPAPRLLHGSHLQQTKQPLLTVILETASMLLGSGVDADQPLMEAGLDSI
ncbi:hypothetical protein ABPG75_000021, partial [Micractinium tetrahymenae]